MLLVTSVQKQGLAMFNHLLTTEGDFRCSRVKCARCSGNCANVDVQRSSEKLVPIAHVISIDEFNQGNLEKSHHSTSVNIVTVCISQIGRPID